MSAGYTASKVWGTETGPPWGSFSGLWGGAVGTLLQGKGHLAPATEKETEAGGRVVLKVT